MYIYNFFFKKNLLSVCVSYHTQYKKKSKINSQYDSHFDNYSKEY